VEAGDEVIWLCDGLVQARQVARQSESRVHAFIMLLKEHGEGMNGVFVHTDLGADAEPLELYDLLGDDGHYLARDAQGNDLAVPRERIVFVQLVNPALAVTQTNSDTPEVTQ